MLRTCSCYGLRPRLLIDICGKCYLPKSSGCRLVLATASTERCLYILILNATLRFDLIAGVLLLPVSTLIRFVINLLYCWMLLLNMMSTCLQSVRRGTSDRTTLRCTVLCRLATAALRWLVHLVLVLQHQLIDHSFIMILHHS